MRQDQCSQVTAEKAMEEQFLYIGKCWVRATRGIKKNKIHGHQLSGNKKNFSLQVTFGCPWQQHPHNMHNSYQYCLAVSVYVSPSMLMISPSGKRRMSGLQQRRGTWRGGCKFLAAWREDRASCLEGLACSRKDGQKPGCDLHGHWTYLDYCVSFLL